MSAGQLTTPSSTPEFDAAVLELGRRLAQRPHSLSALTRSANDRAMTAISSDPGLRAAIFRLVDVAPACASPAELAEHLEALLDGADRRTPIVTGVARAAGGRTSRSATGRAASIGVKRMARRFIAGESPRQAAPALRALWQHGTAVSVDLLGEATVTAAEADAYADRCLEALETLAAEARHWPSRPLLECDSAGVIARVNLSVKVTALTAVVRAHAPERGIADAAPRLRRLLRAARDLGAHLHVDMESFDARDLVLDLVLALLAEPEFADGPSAGIVLQAYLRDSEEVLDRVVAWARQQQRPVPLTVRLVKGAYWDHETIESEQHGWAPPVWTEKAESDRCFERLSRSLIDVFPLLRPAIASHNLRSVAHALVYAERAGLKRGDVEIQVLRGLGDDLQDALAEIGIRGRTYCPIGDLVAGMAYLVRRLLENTANDSFLAGRSSGADLELLLRRP